MNIASRTGLSRRAFLAQSAIGCLAFSAPRAWTGSPPVVTVDRLTLTTVTDNTTFGPFLDNLTLPGLRVARAGNGTQPGATRMQPHALLGEFGLSILAESARGAQSRSVLVDFGYSPEVLKNNLALLGVDPQRIDAAVLSHGHLDHYGGFPGLFGDQAPAGRRIPLVAGGEEAFCERIALIGNPPQIMGALDRAALARAGFDVQIKAQPALLAEHAYTTGIIPLRTAERAAIPTQMRPGEGCDRALLSPSKRSLAQLADDGEHELATYYVVKDLGLVVIACCSHRGVLNSIRRAQELSGIEQVHAVMGGFHLVRPRTESEALQTVAEMAKMKPRYVIPMHCSGEVFIAEALRVMPQAVIRSYVGSRFTFEAGAPTA